MNQEVRPHQAVPLPITACTVVSNCGAGTEVLFKALQAEKTALKKPALFSVDFPAFVGEVAADLLPPIPPSLKAYATRNARLALAALDHDEDHLRSAIERATARYGAERVGIVLGTSTSGIYETEQAYRALQAEGQIPEDYGFPTQHAWVATARFLQEVLQLEGPCYAISTACSSSSKSIAAAQRLITTGVCDAVIAGGIDSLCRMTLHGFHSLNLVSPAPCTPLDADRSGISLGEGAGLMLLERPRTVHQDCVHLLGAGESSDAHHMTAPHPEGKGAALAMTHALAQAGLEPHQIDYLNLHATGTPKNDASELLGVHTVFGPDIHCSGTKGLTGHTLGAAGGIEAAISWLALQQQFLPGTCGLQQLDPAFQGKIVTKNRFDVSVNTVMSNNFGFGGNNASLIFGWLHD